MKYYVLITGSRNATEKDKIAIDEGMYCHGLGKESDIEFVHGGCKGADQIAAAWVRRWKYSEKVFLPDHGNWPKAGPERNQPTVARPLAGSWFESKTIRPRKGSFFLLKDSICIPESTND